MQGDLISRQAVKELYYKDGYIDFRKICELPSVNPQEPCDVAINRQAVIDILEKEGHKWGNDYRDWVDAIEEIKKLPPVNPASNISIQITERGKYGRFN